MRHLDVSLPIQIIFVVIVLLVIYLIYLSFFSVRVRPDMIAIRERLGTLTAVKNKKFITVIPLLDTIIYVSPILPKVSLTIDLLFKTRERKKLIVNVDSKIDNMHAILKKQENGFLLFLNAILESIKTRSMRIESKVDSNRYIEHCEMVFGSKLKNYCATITFDEFDDTVVDNMVNELFDGINLKIVNITINTDK